MATLMCALFEDAQSAEQARRALEAGGFPRQQMDVRAGDELTHQREGQRGDRGDGGVWDRVRALFTRHRDSSKQEAGAKRSESAPDTGRQMSAVNDNEAVLLLNVADDRVPQAAAILGDAGAVDLDSRLGSATEGQAPAQPIYAVVIDEEVAIEAIAPEAEQEGRTGAPAGAQAQPGSPAGEPKPGGKK